LEMGPARDTSKHGGERRFRADLKQQADIVPSSVTTCACAGGSANFTGLCPFHNEKTLPSRARDAPVLSLLWVWESGDVYKFVQKIENLTFPEAVRFIAQKLGVPMPRPPTPRRGSPRGASASRLLDMMRRPAPGFRSSCAARGSAAASTWQGGLNARRLRLPYRMRRLRLPAARCPATDV